MTELVLKVRSLKMLSWYRLIGENVGWKELVLKVRSLKMLSWYRLIGENVGWKMVYNFLGIDEKT